MVMRKQEELANCSTSSTSHAEPLDEFGLNRLPSDRVECAKAKLLKEVCAHLNRSCILCNI
jgi:hypothetical protein